MTFEELMALEPGAKVRMGNLGPMDDQAPSTFVGTAVDIYTEDTKVLLHDDEDPRRYQHGPVTWIVDAQAFANDWEVVL